MVEVVLVQCHLVDDKYQQKSDILHTFKSDKSYAYILNIEPSNLVFLEIHNTDFDNIITAFTDQNGIPLKIVEKVNFTLLINK